MRRTLIFGTAALVALVLLATIVFHNAIVAAVIRSVATPLGYNVGFERLQTGLSSAVATGTTVTNRAGEPVFDAARVELHYSLRDLLPGSRHRFGLTALDIERPKLVLIHHADGTYNVTLPAGSTAPSKPDTTPIDVRARVRDGSVLLLDRFVEPGRERRARIVGLAVDALLAPHTHSYYNARFDLDDGRALHPVVGKATFESDRGFDAQRWTAASLPIGPLIDFALPSHAIDLVDGNLRDVDARIYTFVDAAGGTHTHVSAQAWLERGKLYVAALTKPLRDAAGPIRVYDNGLTTTGIDGTLAGVPLHLAGGIYDLAAPRVRFALNGRGPVNALRRITAAGARLPVGGDLSFAFRAVGPAQTPLVLGTFEAPVLTYGAYVFDRARGSIAVQGTRFDILGARLGYGPIVVSTRGTLALERAVTTNLIASVTGDGDGLPYVPQIIGGLRLNAVAHVSGTGPRLATNGIAYGDGRGGNLEGIFALDAGGNGVVGPLSIERNDGASIYARVAIDRREQSASGILRAQRFALLPARRAALSGLDLAALPSIAGTLDAALAGSVDNGRLTAASGHVELSGVRAGSVTGTANADIAGANDGTQHALVHARTNVGTLDADGTYDNGVIALDGHASSSFEALRALSGDVSGHGRIDVPLRAIIDGSTVAAQIAGARFVNASVRGIPVRDADATVVVHGGTVDVRSARLGIAGGTVIAQGRAGEDTDLVAATSALPLRTLAGATLPVTAGAVLARVHARGRLQSPRADIGLLVDGARVRGVDVAANAVASYDRGVLHVAHLSVLAAGAYATASGDVRSIGPGTPSVDLTADLHGAQIAAIDRVFPLPLRYPEGELDAGVHVRGAAASPQITADVRIPAGSINGLNFRDAHLAANGDLANLAVRGGTVTVGTTTVSFSGDLGRAVQRGAVRAPHVDLADFDDYFDAAETLAGHGHLALDADASPAGVRTAGNVHVDDTRFRRFAIGTADATWRTSGRTVHATARVHGTHGNAALVAGVTLPASAPLRDPWHRVAVNATGSVGAFDLASWLPAAGISAPVAGILDGTVHVQGAPAAPAFSVTAAISNGAAAAYHLDALTLAANGDRRQAHLTSLHLAGAGLRADANGTAGYGAHDPIALALHAQSDDLPTLERAAGLKLVVGGAASTDVRVGGSRAFPRIAQTLDATNISYERYTVPRVHADAAADANTLRINAFEADLAKGRVLATAAIPISLAPPNIGLRDAPLNATLRADAIDLSQFASELPAKSTLAGTIDGRIVASGTPHNPSIDGALALANGTYSSTFVRSPFTNARARLAFTRERAELTGVHTDVGGGTIDGTGSAVFGDVRNLARTLAVNAQLTVQNAGVDINPYLRGKVNGTVTATKPDGRRNTTIGGNVVFSQTRISATSLIPKGQPNAQSTAAPLPVAFDLGIQAGNDVRVLGGGVDVGARGRVTVGGTLAAPTLDGSLTSTDGRLSFYRTFVLQSGTVAFAPADGIIPSVDATATTRISNPDTDILLHVTGLATNLNIDFASNPSYDKEQILGLLVNAQALGAVSGVQTAQNTGGNGFNATSLAGGYLSSELTQSLLEPLGSQLGSSLGLSDLALGYDYGSGFSAGATRAIGKHLSASFHQTFGVDQRQVIGFNYGLPHDAALQLSFFNAGNQSPSIVANGTFLGGQDVFTPANYTLQALQPPPGVAGTVFTYQRKYP